MLAASEFGRSLVPVKSERPIQPTAGCDDLPQLPLPRTETLGLPDRRAHTSKRYTGLGAAEPVLEVSEEFQRLVDLLVSQHTVEMGKYAEQLGNLKAEMEAMEGQVFRLKSENETLRTDSPRGGGAFSPRRAATTSLTQAMVNKHCKMKNLHVEDVMDMLVEEEKHEKPKESDLEKLFRRGMSNASDHTETAEQRQERFAQLSCLDKSRFFLQSNGYEMVMALILIVNVCWMAFELQLKGIFSAHQIGMYEGGFATKEEMEAWDTRIAVGDISFTVIFTIDVGLRVCLLGAAFWKSWLNFIDLGVVLTSLVEITIFYATTMPVNPVLFRLLRIGKLARAFRMVHMTSVLASLQLLVKCLASSATMLFWSFLLLTFVQSVAGLIISTLCFDFIRDESIDLAVREEVFKFFGTFSRTFLTMFEVMFANWGPPCRVLMENVSEWYSVFFLFYRCVLGFAVLNIINAVFVQQTMKTASSDEEIAFKQKQRDAAAYTKKVKKMFQTMDDSGDGALSLEEFGKLVRSPKLQFWMGQLELEYHDLLSLFEFLDNGDGEITLMEFVEGAARLRGGAKAIDIWRIETKLEVLFEEVLKLLEMPSRMGSGSLGVSSVQNVFSRSAYRHIKANSSATSG